MAAPTPALTCDYSILPPNQLPGAPNVSAADTLAIPLAAAEPQSQLSPAAIASISRTAQYYHSASTALRTLQADLNAILTAWKDAIGDLEKSKEDLGEVKRGMGRATRMARGYDAGGNLVDADGGSVRVSESGSEDDEDGDEV